MQIEWNEERRCSRTVHKTEICLWMKCAGCDSIQFSARRIFPRLINEIKRHIGSSMLLNALFHRSRSIFNCKLNDVYCNWIPIFEFIQKRGCVIERAKSRPTQICVQLHSIFCLRSRSIHTGSGFFYSHIFFFVCVFSNKCIIYVHIHNICTQRCVSFVTPKSSTDCTTDMCIKFKTPNCRISSEQARMHAGKQTNRQRRCE